MVAVPELKEAKIARRKEVSTINVEYEQVEGLLHGPSTADQL